jgi:hypothetical protein
MFRGVVLDRVHESDSKMPFAEHAKVMLGKALATVSSKSTFVLI